MDSKNTLIIILIAFIAGILLTSVIAFTIIKGHSNSKPCPSAQPLQSPALNPQPQQQSGRQNVIINGKKLNSKEISNFEQLYSTQLSDGNYWYDNLTGGWGTHGGPCQGFISPGLNLGGRLAADASGGGNGSLTGVFINGRELHPYDVAYLQQFVAVYQGRYWLDAQGNYGYENGPALGNLYQMASAYSSSSGGGSSGAWGYRSNNLGASVGGDGSGFSYYIDKDTSYTGGS